MGAELGYSQEAPAGDGLRVERGTGNETAMSLSINAIELAAPSTTANPDSTHPGLHRQTRVAGAC
jgi:hypothetical protein